MIGPQLIRRMIDQARDLLSLLLHLLLLDDKVLPVEHLHLGVVLALLQQGKQVVHFLEDCVLLHNDVILLLSVVLWW